MKRSLTFDGLLRKKRDGFSAVPIIDSSALDLDPRCSDDLVPYIDALRMVGSAAVDGWRDSHMEAEYLVPPIEPDPNKPFPKSKPIGFALEVVDGVERMERKRGIDFGTPTDVRSAQSRADSWLEEKRRWDACKTDRHKKECALHEKLSRVFESNQVAKASLLAAHDMLVRAVLSGKINLFWYHGGKKVQGQEGILADPQVSNYVLSSGTMRFNKTTKPVFLDRASLKKTFLDPEDYEEDKANHLLDGVHLSPYMKLLLHVAKNEQITPEKQPTVVALEAMIEQEAHKFGLDFPKTPKGNPHRKVTVMAQVLREP